MTVSAHPSVFLVEFSDIGFPCCRLNVFSAFWYSSKDFGGLDQTIQYFAAAKDLLVISLEILSSISLCACSILHAFSFFSIRPSKLTFSPLEHM